MADPTTEQPAADATTEQQPRRGLRGWLSRRANDAAGLVREGRQAVADATQSVSDAVTRVKTEAQVQAELTALRARGLDPDLEGQGTDKDGKPVRTRLGNFVTNGGHIDFDRTKDLQDAHRAAVARTQQELAAAEVPKADAPIITAPVVAPAAEQIQISPAFNSRALEGVGADLASGISTSLRGITLDVGSFASEIFSTVGQAVGAQTPVASATALLDAVKAYPSSEPAQRGVEIAAIKNGFANLSDAEKLSFQQALKETYAAADDNRRTSLANMGEAVGLDTLKVITGDADSLHLRAATPLAAAPAAAAPVIAPGGM